MGQAVVSPLVECAITVENLGAGRTSLYALLAADTLCFSVKVVFCF